MALTDTACRNAKPREKPYKLADAEGMYLEVAPTGGKYWKLKYRFLGKEKKLSMGSYPATGLGDARERRLAAQKLLECQIDPAEHKKAEKVAMERVSGNTFELVALEWHKQT